MSQEDYIHTDLACERRQADTDIPGVSYYEESIGVLQKSVLHVASEEGARTIGKPCGSYITLSFKPLWQQNEQEIQEASVALSSVLLEMMPKKEHLSLLVAGLGNRALTVDAIGPSTIRKVIATAHLAELEPELFSTLNCHKIAAIAPGVLGETGMESADLIKGAVRASAPDALIVVDALVARSCSRLASTVQISDTGILPGGGVGNPRAAIDEESIGVPVIVVGVPTVVDSATLLYDALTNAGIEEIPDEFKKVLDSQRGYFVSPRECDAVTENVSHMIAVAINTAFGIQ